MSDDIKRDAMSLASETGYDWRTCVKWLLEGRSAVHRSTHMTLSIAAATLDIQARQVSHDAA